MTAAAYYDRLATADINADEALLTGLATSKAAPQLVQFYAAHKASAIKARKAGRIDEAVRWEDTAETLYRQIPKRYRW
jgi:hypothetical protein